MHNIINLITKFKNKYKKIKSLIIQIIVKIIKKNILFFKNNNLDKRKILS